MDDGQMAAEAKAAADEELTLDQLAKAEKLTPAEINLLERVLARAPGLSPAEALRQLRAAGM